jgi:predicted phosphoserine aminotransferase
MRNSIRRGSQHIKLFIPGPTEVRPEILEAQTQWMIGHRMPECADLFARIQVKIRQVFKTRSRVYINASSGTGLQEAAIRNCTSKKVLNCVNGAFADRWRQVTEANGKDNAVLEVEWGQPILPELVVEQLSRGDFDAVTIVHNETSTGLTNPIGEIARAVRQMPGGDGLMLLVDSVSGLSGANLEFDAWDLDVVLTSSQKAFALPAGLAFCAVSDRALEKARTVPHRGYYFDFLELEKYLLRNQTPATPAISLMFALDRQLNDMLDEGIDNRLARHLAMRDMTINWISSRKFGLFASEGYRSATITCARNNLGIDISALNRYLRHHGFIISNGYGQLKEKTFRIAHMGDIHAVDLAQLFGAIDDFLRQNGTKTNLSL